MKLTLKNFIGTYKNKNSRIFVIADLHLPYQHPSALNFLKKVKEKYKPTRVISIGDLFDQYSFSRWDKNPEADSVLIEVEKAKKDVQKLAKIFPNLEIVMGNHDKRLTLKAQRAGIPAQFLKDKQEIYGTPSTWKWHPESLTIDDIYFTHGKTSAYNKLSKLMGLNSVQGHHHKRAGVTYWSSPLTLRWDAFTGCLADPHHYSQEYCRNDAERPLLGSLMIIEGQPLYLQFKMKKGGKWDGKVR